MHLPVRLSARLFIREYNFPIGHISVDLAQERPECAPDPQNGRRERERERTHPRTHLKFSLKSKTADAYKFAFSLLDAVLPLLIKKYTYHILSLLPPESRPDQNSRDRKIFLQIDPPISNRIFLEDEGWGGESFGRAGMERR